ncbi:hypothetical protein D3C87_1101570 [compost metagenome]
MEAVLHLAVEAAQVRGQEVADGVAGANVVRVATKATRTAGGVETAGRRDQVGANAVGAERIEHGVVPERRGVITAQTNFTETTRQAHGRATSERRNASCAVVVGDRGFEPEAGCQATTQVFRTTEAQTAGVVARVSQFATACLDAALVQVERVQEGGTVQVTRGGRVAADRRVDHTKQRDGRLSRGNTGNSQGSQSN